MINCKQYKAYTNFSFGYTQKENVLLGYNNKTKTPPRSYFALREMLFI